MRRQRHAVRAVPRHRLPVVVVLSIGCLMAAAIAPRATALTDAELDAVRLGFEDRRDTYLDSYLDEPLYQMDSALAGCRAYLSEAQWIWCPGEDATEAAPLGVRHFRCNLALPKGKAVKAAYGVFAADNYGDLRVDGKSLGRVSGFSAARPVDLTDRLPDDPGVITVSVHNDGAEANPAGLLGVVYVLFEDGTDYALLTDEKWRVSDQETVGWDRPGFDDTAWRSAEVLGNQGIAPWGPVALSLEMEVNRYVFTRLTFALAALHRETDIVGANVALRDAVAQIRAERLAVGEFGLHWMGGLFYRIYGLFGPGGTLKHHLEEETAAPIRELFAEWARAECRLSDANPRHTWRIWGSENHSAQRDATAWAAARMLSSSPDTASLLYNDGSTPRQQLGQWSDFLKQYFRERVKRGMLVEISPSGYGSRTLQGWHNIYDFTDDEELKRLAKAALDVWWAEWAQEQLGGMRGGGKCRLYPGAWALARTDRNRAMAWFYLGLGRAAHHHETLPVIATTSYRMPAVVMDIALDPEGRGVYECKSRRLGRQLDPALSESLSEPNEPVYCVDPDYGGIARYSYCTPDFIVGCLMVKNRPNSYWTAISSQNRWHGVIFAGPENSTLYPRCETSRSTYNAHWAVQRKGTLIAQKLRQAEGAGAMRICFSEDLERKEEGGWIFARASRAFAAAKVVSGAWSWDDEIWLRCAEEYSPVIIEVARAEDYADDFAAFRRAVLGRDITFEDGVLRYRGLGDSGDFTFYTGSDRLPKIDGVPIDLSPPYAFQSPFLQEAWGTGLVRIEKDDRKLIVDVRD